MAFLTLPYPDLSVETDGFGAKLVEAYENQVQKWQTFLALGDLMLSEDNPLAEVSPLEMTTSLPANPGLAFLYRDPSTDPNRHGRPFDMIDAAGELMGQRRAVPRGFALALNKVTCYFVNPVDGSPKTYFDVTGPHEAEGLTALVRFHGTQELKHFIGIAPFPPQMPNIRQAFGTPEAV